MFSAVVIATFIAAAQAQTGCDLFCQIGKIQEDDQNELGDLFQGLQGLDLGKLFEGFDLDLGDLNNFNFGELDFSKLDFEELTKQLEGNDQRTLQQFCVDSCKKLEGTQFASHKDLCDAGCNNLSSLQDLLVKQAADAKLSLDDLRAQLAGLTDGDSDKLSQLTADFQKFAGDFLAGQQFSDEQKALAAQFGANLDQLRAKAIGLLGQIDANPGALDTAANDLRASLFGAVGSDDLVAQVQKQLAQLNLEPDQQAVVVQLANVLESSLGNVRDAVTRYGGVIDEISELIKQRKRQEAADAAAPARKNFVIVAPMPRIGVDVSIADLSDLLATVDGQVAILGVVTQPEVEKLGAINEEIFQQQNTVHEETGAASISAVHEETGAAVHEETGDAASIHAVHQETGDAASIITIASVAIVGAIALLF